MARFCPSVTAHQHQRVGVGRGAEVDERAGGDGLGEPALGVVAVLGLEVGGEGDQTPAAGVEVGLEEVAGEVGLTAAGQRDRGGAVAADLDQRQAREDGGVDRGHEPGLPEVGGREVGQARDQGVEAGLALDLLEQHHVGLKLADRGGDLVGAVGELGRRIDLLEGPAAALAAVTDGVEEQVDIEGRDDDVLGARLRQVRGRRRRRAVALVADALARAGDQRGAGERARREGDDREARTHEQHVRELAADPR